MAGAAKLPPIQTVLRDGTPVLIRPVRPSDKALIREGLKELSEESRYRRFMSPIHELSDAQLRYLTEVDFVDHVAWAAVHARRRREGMGVGRYVRLKDEPHVAEAAVTVVDRYHGLGLGTLLLAVLAASARTGGVTTFRGYVLQSNVAMRELLEQLGAKTEPEGRGVLRMDVDLDPEVLPDSPAARVLKAVAEGVVLPLPGERLAPDAATLPPPEPR